MSLIVDQPRLDSFCAALNRADFIAVDTEFLRDRTFWPRLCLVQVAGPEEEAAIDPLAPGLDLRPLLELMANPRVLKVFHAARQDLEIFYNLTGRVPAPLFDTQVAAMVLGYGDQVSYESLAAEISKARLDKSMRFTDWSARPLTDRQIAYALADVIHLRQIYPKLGQRLSKNGRAAWLGEEMGTLLDPATYSTDPADAWLRMKPRTATARMLAVLREIAAWREREAQRRDVPRARVMRDEAVIDIATHMPRSVAELGRLRGLPHGFAEGRMGAEVLEAVARGRTIPDAECPTPAPSPPKLPRGIEPIVELLKVLLKLTCEEHDVAQRLVATTADLERIAADDEAPVPALQGWRREVFGEAALKLKRGEIGLAINGRKITRLSLPSAAD